MKPQGCLFILAILLCTVAAMLFVAAAYAHAAAAQWRAAVHSVIAAGLCVGVLLLFTAKLKP